MDNPTDLWQILAQYANDKTLVRIAASDQTQTKGYIMHPPIGPDAVATVAEMDGRNPVHIPLRHITRIAPMP